MCKEEYFAPYSVLLFSILYGVYACFSLVFRNLAVMRNEVSYVTLVNSVAQVDFFYGAGNK
jgi:hypothetical protein